MYSIIPILLFKHIIIIIIIIIIVVAMNISSVFSTPEVHSHSQS